jgi:hypothetical protein
MCDISKGVANTLLPKKYVIKKRIDIMYQYREKVAFATHVYCTYCIIMPALLRLTFRHFFAQLTVLKNEYPFYCK